MPVVYSFSNNKGLKKERNEDAINVSKNKQGNLLSVICDGVSSHKESSISSNYIVKEITKNWKKTKFNNYEELKEWILETVKLLNKEIIEKSRKKSKKMATTIVLTVIYEDRVLVVNVGDSLSYGIRDNLDYTMLTKDDSFVGVLLDAGVLTKEEANVHPKRHTLTQAVGVTEEIDIHITESNIYEYSYILSCSDGLTTMLDITEIADIIQKFELSIAIEKLIDKANERGGVDNISISIFKILRGGENDR